MAEQGYWLITKDKIEVTGQDTDGYTWYQVEYTEKGKKIKGWMREDVIRQQKSRRVLFSYKVDIICKKFNKDKYQTITVYPRNSDTWFILGKGSYPQICPKINGRWAVAVGPAVLEEDYDDEGMVYEDDFYSFSKCIKVHLIHKNNQSKLVIECQVVDLKAHTYTDYGYKNKKTGKNEDNIEKAIVYNLKNGLVQTGIRYPNATNGLSISKMENMDGSIIEFCGHKLDNGLEEKLRNYNMNYIQTNYTSSTRGQLFKKVK